jgi:hypothetical protein
MKIMYRSYNQPFKCNSIDLYCDNEINSNITIWTNCKSEDISINNDGFIDIDVTDKELTRERIIELIELAIDSKVEYIENHSSYF